MNNLEKARTPEVIAAEIRTFTASMLNNIIEIGRRMCEAKEMLDHGEFLPWIEENTGYSRSTANNFMRLYEEYGDRQGSLFGAEVSNVQTFGHLTYSKALALLALPSGERENFVENHDVDEMSTRELKQAIRERDEAKAAAEYSEKKLGELAKAFDESQTALENEHARTLELNTKIKELESRPVEVAVEVDEEAVKKAADEAKAKAEAEWSARVREAEDRLAKAKEAAKKAKEKAKAADANAGKEAAAELAKAKKAAEEARAESERLRKELAMSDAAVTAFKVHFAAWQSSYQAMLDTIGKAGEETGGKLKAAIAAQIEAWKGGAA